MKYLFTALIALTLLTTGCGTDVDSGYFVNLFRDPKDAAEVAEALAEPPTVEGDILTLKVSTTKLIELSTRAADEQHSPNYTYLSLKPGSEDTITPKNNPEHWSPHYPNMVHEKARDGRYYTLRETGWGISGNPGPRFDRNFEHWIYLHAESNVIYDLNAGEYDRFDGYVCLSDIWFPVAGCGHSGTVQFTFQLDNDIVYRSGVLRGIDQDEPIPVSFEIPADAQALIINVSDGGDWIGCDHWMLGNARLRHRYP